MCFHWLDESPSCKPPEVDQMLHNIMVGCKRKKEILEAQHIKLSVTHTLPADKDGNSFLSFRRSICVFFILLHSFQSIHHCSTTDTVASLHDEGMCLHWLDESPSCKPPEVDQMLHNVMVGCKRKKEILEAQHIKLSATHTLQADKGWQ